MSGFGDPPPDLDRPGFGTPARPASDDSPPAATPDSPPPLAGSPPAPAGPAPAPRDDLPPAATPDPPPADDLLPAPAGPAPAPRDDSPPAPTARIAVRVNGDLHTAEVEPRTLLSDFLRHQLGLTGTKVGCESGECGSCTVQLDGEPVLACLTFAIQVDQAQIKTIEGLEPGHLQQAFHEHHALQCGFCTAGILLTLDAFLKDHPEPSETRLKQALAGNQCRCTGYAPIIDAVRHR